jgi:uncharacterized protein
MPFYHLLLFVGLLILPSKNYGASFDCKKASSSAEKTICTDESLSLLDDQVSDRYQSLRSDKTTKSFRQELRVSQKKWIVKRDNCSDDRACLIHIYETRIEQLTNIRKIPIVLIDKNSSVAKNGKKYRNKDSNRPLWYILVGSIVSISMGFFITSKTREKYGEGFFGAGFWNIAGSFLCAVATFFIIENFDTTYLIPSAGFLLNALRVNIKKCNFVYGFLLTFVQLTGFIILVVLFLIWRDKTNGNRNSSNQNYA